MGTCLDNLAAAATQEKDVLDKLVSNNAKLVGQLELLTKKFEQLSNQDKDSANSSVPLHNGKRLKLVQCNKNGSCHTHRCKCIKKHTSKTSSKPGPNYDQDATRNNTRGGSTKHKDWVCAHYKEKGFWVPSERN